MDPCPGGCQSLYADEAMEFLPPAPWRAGARLAHTSVMKITSGSALLLVLIATGCAGPAARDPSSREVVECLGESQPRQQRQPGGERRGERVAHEHRERQRGSRRCDPRAVEPAAARRLVEGEQDRKSVV